MEDQDDVLTNLPEGIKTSILSLLQTADSVKTSVLSKKWENMWKYVHDLQFDDTYRASPTSRRVHFVDFVYQVLMNSECKILNSFNLSCSKTLHPRHVESWVRTAMKRQVKNLTINYENENVVFSGPFLNCESFRRLELRGAMTLKVSPEISFPNLTELYLIRTRFRHEEKDDNNQDLQLNLHLNFPVLKVLHMIRCMWHHVECISILGTRIEEFLMNWCYYNCVCCGERRDFRIEMIGCPTLITRGVMLENVCITVPELVVNAEFCQQFEYGVPENLEWIQKSSKRAVNLLGSFSNITTLKLSTDVIEAIAREDAPFSFPLLNKVTNLSVYSGIQKLTWCGALMKLLHSLPSLILLQFNVSADYWRVDIDHAEPFEVPNCIYSTLQVVHFEQFGASESEIRLVIAILNHAAVLKQVSIITAISSKPLLEYIMLTVPKATSEATMLVEFLRGRKRRHE